jgi:threonine/homoserine/homoserine lactone efflux protein
MTPGPNMGYLAVLGLSRGRAAGLSAVLGIALGLGLLGIAVGLGIGSYILDNRFAYETVRWVGALYLCWLAFDSWIESRRPPETGPLDLSLIVYFRRGLVTNVLNPKAGLFFVAVLPDFVDGSTTAVTQLSILIATYVGVATLVHTIIVMLAGAVQPYLSRPKWRRGAGNFFAATLLVLAVWLFMKGAR